MPRLPKSLPSRLPLLLRRAPQPHHPRPFTSTPHLPSDAPSNYDPPTGWLWGVPPGEKREREGWEYLWIVGFFGSLAAAGVAYAYKPDTSIQTWALEEARRRLEAEGILPDPDPEGKKE